MAFETVSLIWTGSHWLESLPWLFLLPRSVFKIDHWEVSIGLLMSQFWEIWHKVGAAILVLLLLSVSLSWATSCLQNFRLEACLWTVHHEVVFGLFPVRSLRSLILAQLRNRLSLCQRSIEDFWQFHGLSGYTSSLLLDIFELFQGANGIVAMRAFLVLRIIEAYAGIEWLIHLNRALFFISYFVKYG